MIISFSEEDLRRMPARLRERILDHVSQTAGETPAPSVASKEAVPTAFRFSRPPPGARHPRDLVSFTREQGLKFVEFLHGTAEDSCNDLFYFLGEDVQNMNPTDLAGLLELKSQKTGEPDARLVSPFLKTITHAVRRFTCNEAAAWYTIDPMGNFYLDPGTLDALRYAWKEWEGKQSMAPEEEGSR
jgi:hypothetical protein